MNDSTILVVGAGAWGTALASVCARAGQRVLLWDSDRALSEALRATRRHPRFASTLELETAIEPIVDLPRRETFTLALVVVPFQVLRQALASLAGALSELPPIACAAKGLELDSGLMAHEIVAAMTNSDVPFAQVSGPNFAIEIMQGRPAAITVGARDEAFGRDVVARLHGPSFRSYYTADVIGVEVGGALKNVIAIAAGIADGLALGANTRAALVTRGLAEIARFGVARGGRMETFMGLSGMGDLVLTCTDDQSRNRRFGLALAATGSVSQASAAVGALVEGVATAQAIDMMANKCNIEMPIAREVAKVLAGTTTPREAVQNLLAREASPAAG